ncbi:flagellar biosynthetic protein FlhB [Spirochaetota bacterium]|nr:flagellar biosynthetic protein FlhB [Spirochaetota bacterium]
MVSRMPETSNIDFLYRLSLQLRTVMACRKRAAAIFDLLGYFCRQYIFGGFSGFSDFNKRYLKDVCIGVMQTRYLKEAEKGSKKPPPIPMAVGMDSLLAEYPFIIDLHAEEDQSSRTEEPTETRKRKAREEGEVFLTQELPQSLLIIFVMSTVVLFASYYYKSLAEHLAGFLENRNQVILDVNTIGYILRKSLLLFATLFVPIGAIAWVTVVLGTMTQTKFFISVKPLRFNPKKIVPSFKNFMERTVFSRTQLINTIKLLLKFVVSTVIISLFFTLRFEDFVEIFRLDTYDALKQSSLYAYEVMMYLGLFLLVLAVPDWLVQRLEFLRKLKMTREEVKREIKDLEGDPIIRQRQRERARQLATQGMLENVKTADVLITNPTHFACALSYDLDQMDAPKLVAKGVDNLALKLRELARSNNVPIVENKPLARALYYKVNVDDYIPNEFYTIIAEILSALDKFKK